MKTRREARGNWRLLSFYTPQNQNSALNIIDLKGTLIMKYLITFLRRNCVHLHWKYMLLVVEVWKCLHGCVHFAWYLKNKNMEFVSFKNTRKWISEALWKQIWRLYTSIWTFFILQKISFCSSPCRLFFQIFCHTTHSPTQMIFFFWFLLVDNRTM